MAIDPNKNKLIIPDTAPTGTAGCPKCGARDFSGRMMNGMVVRKCRPCGNEWAGGLPQQPQDPRVPAPYDPYVPPVRFVHDSKGEVQELRRRIDPTPDYRKGAKIPEGDE